MPNDASRPVRLRLSRRRGFNLQNLSLATNGLPAIRVARPGRFGNPFTTAGCREAGYYGSDEWIAQRCVNAFSAWLTSPYWRTNWDGQETEKARAVVLDGLPSLRGKNLACWCRLCPRHATTGKPFGEDCPDCPPCHADTLGMICEGV
jgi:hypothetical protein